MTRQLNLTLEGCARCPYHRVSFKYHWCKNPDRKEDKKGYSEVSKMLMDEGCPLPETSEEKTCEVCLNCGCELPLLNGNEENDFKVLCETCETEKHENS